MARLNEESAAPARPEGPESPHNPAESGGSARKGLWERMGPGLVISASFIGPGTITTATVTGASYGYALAWAIVFSIVATIILQEMSARLGIVTGQGLGEALRETFQHPVLRVGMVVLIVAAIGIGGASYAGGDTTGTALGLAGLTGLPDRLLMVVVAAIIFALLITGSYKVIERALVVMVAVLAAVFLLTMIVVTPDLGAIVRGAFVPTVPTGALLTTIALIGTTVVPYNLFLHANLAHEKWGGLPQDRALRDAQKDTIISISIGGVITLAIMITAAAAMWTQGVTAESGADMAAQLEPLLGPAAQYVFALGLLAAGLTSAVAGPLGAAFAICGVMGWGRDMTSPRFKAVWICVMLIGLLIALTGVNPIQVIILAQAANGLLLPIVAGFLLVVMSRTSVLGRHTNGPVATTLGGLVFVVVTGLAVYQFADIFGLLPS